MNNTITPSILVIGENGQIAWEIKRSAIFAGKVFTVSSKELDLRNHAAIRSILARIKPLIVINAAAYTDVEQAETNQEEAFLINAEAPSFIARELKQWNGQLVHFSTDYVFDGNSDYPYSENDKPNPLNIYGASKLKGEVFIRESGIPHIIIRTSWVYGERGNNFFLTMLRLFKERDEISVVNDQVGVPSWSRFIAQSTIEIIRRLNYKLPDQGEIYHLTPRGETTWYNFAGIILKKVNRFNPSHCRLIPISSEEYHSRVRRPKYSILSCEKIMETFGLCIPDWEYLLDIVLDNYYSVRAI
jgi:dTDP-4-dehydrorhamnose reductase